MNPDRRPTSATTYARERALTAAPALGPRDIAPWVIASVREWPQTVEDRLVAAGLGVQLHHVKLAREARP